MTARLTAGSQRFVAVRVASAARNEASARWMTSTDRRKEQS
ncbi:hypothetical protein HMPREF0321_1783 [Dermacoccus sp. Ellin185]|nr:hypothetical protein HMPREF0321_1783 [Dermacoccus sp. Ellin185]